MSTIFRRLQVKKWQPKKQTLFSFCMINDTKFGDLPDGLFSFHNDNA